LVKVDSSSHSAPTHVGIRLKVEHTATAYHFNLEPFTIKDVGTRYPDLGVLSVVADEPLLTSAEIVINSYVGSRLGKPINNMAPDKAGATSHECALHVG
jgi:hypothetical protein